MHHDDDEEESEDVPELSSQDSPEDAIYVATDISSAYLNQDIGAEGRQIT